MFKEFFGSFFNEGVRGGDWHQSIYIIEYVHYEFPPYVPSRSVDIKCGVEIFHEQNISVHTEKHVFHK